MLPEARTRPADRSSVDRGPGTVVVMPETDYLTVTRAAYDTVAPDYARLLADALDRMPWDRAALATFVELVSRDRLGPVADVGCGPGQLEQQLHAAGLPVRARVVRAPDDPETVPQAYLLARKRSAAPSRPPLSGRRRRQRAAWGSTTGQTFGGAAGWLTCRISPARPYPPGGCATRPSPPCSSTS